MSKINDNNESELFELAEKIKSSENAPGIDIKKDGNSIEFEFSVGIPKTALVFEEGIEDFEAGELEAAEPVISELQIAKDAEPIPEQAQSTATAVEEPALRDVDEEEFIIPDSFVIGEDFPAPLSEDGTPIIWTTYVPRFTEASEKSYRFIDDDEARRRDEIKRAKMSGAHVSDVASSKPNDALLMSEANSAAFVNTISDKDVTAELDAPEVLEGAVVVNTNGKPKENRETISVFKFSANYSAENDASSDESAKDNSENENPKMQSSPDEIDLPEALTEENAKDSVKTDSDIREMPHPARTRKACHNFADDELPKNERPRGYANMPRAEDNGGNEYTYFTQRDKFKDRFLDSIMSSRVRLGVTALLALIVIVFENIGIFIKDFYSAVGLTSPLAVGIVDAIFVIGIFALAIPEAVRGIRQLKSGVVTIELSIVVSAAVTVLYTVVLSVCLDLKLLLGSIYAVIVVSSVFATYCLQSAAFTAFKTISDKGDKRIIDVRFTRDLERENMTLDGAVDEYKSKIARDFKTTFVAGFFKNSARSAENHKNNLLILGLTLGIGLVLGGVMFFVGDGLSSMICAFAISVALGIPAFSMLSHKLTYYHSEQELAANSCAVIGEGSYYDAVGVDVVAFDDTEIFGEDDVTFKSVSLSDKRGDFRKAMRILSQLFGALGGPLEKMLVGTLGKKYPAAQEVEIENDGALGIVDGATVMAGTADYMKRHGISVPQESGFSLANTRIMYAAENGELFARLSIQYSFSEEFARMLSALREEKIIPLVYSRDPNVNNELMKFLTGGKDCIRVMKKQTVVPNEEKAYPALDSGLASMGDKNALVNMLIHTRRYARLQSGISLTELAASLAGAVLAALVSICNMTAAIPSALIAIWHLAWCTALFVMSKRSFKFRRRKNK